MATATPALPAIAPTAAAAAAASTLTLESVVTLTPPVTSSTASRLMPALTVPLAWATATEAAALMAPPDAAPVAARTVP